MQRIIMVVIVLAAIGIVSAFAASQLVPSHEAGAAPQVFPPSPQGRLILVAENVNLSPPNNTFTTDYVDTAGCRSLAAFINHTGTDIAVVPYLILSADGITANGFVGGVTQLHGDVGGLVQVDGTLAYFPVGQEAGNGMPIVAAKTALFIQEVLGNPATIDKAWLFCSP
jgi:hypothetical protein